MGSGHRLSVRQGEGEKQRSVLAIIEGTGEVGRFENQSSLVRTTQRSDQAKPASVREQIESVREANGSVIGQKLVQSAAPLRDGKVQAASSSQVPTEAEMKEMNRQLAEMQGQLLNAPRADRKQLKLQAEAKEKEVNAALARFEKARILQRMAEAAAEEDAVALEQLLNEAVSQGIASTELEASRRALEKLQKESLMRAKLELKSMGFEEPEIDAGTKGLAETASFIEALKAVLALPDIAGNDAESDEVDLHLDAEEEREDEYTRRAREITEATFVRSDAIPWDTDPPDTRPVFGWLPLGTEFMIWNYNYAQYNDPRLRPPEDTGDDIAYEAKDPVLKEYRRAGEMIEIQLLRGCREVEYWFQEIHDVFQGLAYANFLDGEINVGESEKDATERILREHQEEVQAKLTENHEKAQKLLKAFEVWEKRRVDWDLMQRIAKKIFLKCQDLLMESGTWVKMVRYSFTGVWKAMQAKAWGSVRPSHGARPESNGSRPRKWYDFFSFNDDEMSRDASGVVQKNFFHIEDVSQAIEDKVNEIVRSEEITNYCIRRIKKHEEYTSVKEVMRGAFRDIANENVFADGADPQQGSAREQLKTIRTKLTDDHYKEQALILLTTKIKESLEGILKPRFHTLIRERIMNIYLRRRDGVWNDDDVWTPTCCCDDDPRSSCPPDATPCDVKINSLKPCKFKTASEILEEEAALYKTWLPSTFNSSARKGMKVIVKHIVDRVMREVPKSLDGAKTWVQGQEYVTGEVDVLDCTAGWNAFAKMIDKVIPKPGDVVKFAFKLRIPPAPPIPAYITIGLVGEAARGIQGHVVGLPQYGSPEWTELKLTLSIGGEIKFVFADWSHEFQLIIRAAATGANRAVKGLWYVVYQVLLEREWDALALLWAGTSNKREAEIRAAAYEEYIYDPDERYRGNVAFGDLMLYTKSSFTFGLPGVASLKVEAGLGGFKRFNKASITGVYGEHQFRRAVVGQERTRQEGRSFGWTPRFHFLFEGKFLNSIKVQGMYAQANVKAGGASAWGVWLKTSFPIVPAGLGLAVAMIRGINGLLDIYNDVASWMSANKSGAGNGAGLQAMATKIDLTQIDAWREGMAGCEEALPAILKTNIHNSTWTYGLGALELAFYIGGKVLPEASHQHITYARVELNIEVSAGVDATIVAAKMSLKKRLASFGMQKLPQNPETWRGFADYNGDGRLPYGDIPEYPEM